MEKVSVPTDAGRLIQAIARIGYDPEVALCDLIDNSIDAICTEIHIHLIQQSQEDEGKSDSISSYLIVDDGCGMDREGIIQAFTLGGTKDYATHSLGKFGLGLKSAGLSLGDIIVLISKTDEIDSPVCGILSTQSIYETGEYKIDIGEAPDKYKAIWEKYSISDAKGTILVLESLNENNPRYSNFLDYLSRHCSVIYHMFMEDKSNPIQIYINEKHISATDPLFLNEANNNGPLNNPEEWDGQTVNLLLDTHELSLTSGVGCLITATNLIHPPTYDLLEPGKGKRAEMREKYNIETDPYTRRSRHGFYIYRNNRVIVLAERFRGMVTSATQGWAFRGRLMFDESADSILSLDVKKRHCILPKEARSNLVSMIKIHVTKSVEAWKSRGRQVRAAKGDNKEKFANESILATPIIDLGYAPGADLSNKAALEARKKLMEELEEDTLKKIIDTKVTKESLGELAQKRSAVEFVQGLKGNAMWLPYPAVHYGAAQTLINKSHSWISEAYAAAEDEPIITIILHQLITILARAELEMRSIAWDDIPQGVTDKVLERFRKKASAIGEDLADSLTREINELSGNIEDEED